MYILTKNGREICRSRHLRTCAKQLNRIAGFRVVDCTFVDGREEYIDRVCWIIYKEYTLMHKIKK